MQPISRWQWPWTATARRPISRHTIALTLALIVLGLAISPGAAFAATRTWKGAGGGTWLNVTNWVGNVQPVPGDTLIFPAGAAGPVVNDFPPDTKFAAITVAEGYTISGARIQLTNSLTVTDDGNQQAWIAANILLEAPVMNTKTFLISAPTNTQLLVTGVISGNDTVQLRKEGAGRAILDAANAYAGATLVAEGPLEIRSTGSLGLNTKGTTINPGASLVLEVAGGSITEPLTLIGDDVQGPEGTPNLSVGQAVTWNAPVTLQGLSQPTVYLRVATADLRLSGVISGAQGFGLYGRATLTMSGPSSNTYAGVTTIWTGAAVLDKNPGAIAMPAGLVIGLPEPANAATVTLGTNDQIQSTVTIDETGHLALNGFNDTINALVLKGGRVTTGLGTLTLAGNILVSQSSQTAVIEGQLSLGNDSRTFNVPSTAQPGLDVKAVIKSPIPAGLTKMSAGSVRFSGANSYTGNTVITAGTIELAHASALGPGGATIIKTGARLNVAADGSTEALFPEGTPGTDGSTIAAVGPGKRTFNGNIIFNGPLLAFAEIGASLHFGGSVSGSGGDLKFVGLGTVIELGKTTSYAGSTLAAGARIKLMVAQAIPDGSRVELLPSGQLDLNGFNDTIGGLASNSATSVFLGGGTLTVATKTGATDTYAGAFSGTGELVKTGTGTWVLTGTSAAATQMRVSAGTVRVMGSIANAMTLAGGTLEGKGSVGTIGGSTGTLRPGSSPGVLHSKSVVLGAGVTVAIAIDGPVVGSEYAQLEVTGSVNLGGASLALAVSPNFLPAGAGDLIIVNNDGIEPIAGTFSGLPEGAVVDAGGGKTFRITYAGGSGNDVVLSAQGGSTYYLSEGATGGFFDLDILIANPNAADAPVTLTFLREDGDIVVAQRTVPAMQRITVRVDDIAGVEDTPVSTVVKSDDGSPLIVERTMRWDQSGYGAHTEKAAGGTALTWFFAEGSQGFFSTYLLLANPGATPGTATVQYLREGLPALTRAYPIAAGSRFTVNAGADPELVNTSFGMSVTFDQPGIAERAMYFGSDPVWKGGHESAGVTAPSPTWFLAEGATGPFFETFVLIANPNGADAIATLTFLTSDGMPIVKEKTVPANGRLTVNIESEDPALANAAVSTRIDASLPVIVERAQYWPDPAPQWYEAHNSFGVTAAATKWGLAEGRTGGDAAYQTYVLIANPGATAANVTITFLLESGAPVTKTFTVQPTSRFNVSTGEGTSVPEVANQRFGAVLTSDQPIVVERAMYANAGGQTWAAGTNATATRLP